MAIGVAIIGAGIFAREEHIPAVGASKDLVLKAIYSRSFNSAKTLVAVTSEVAIYSEDSASGNHYQDLLKRSDIDAVIIALPIKRQPEYIRSALSAGKHVLSEKPITENVSDAVDLIQWYHSNVDSYKITWSVAENFRYLNSFDHARGRIQELGRVLGFRVRMYANVQQGSKYYETQWRKTPTHQGGFLLDGGVHFTAGLRLLLGSENAVTRLSAFTAQLQKHLPPVNTVDATLKTKTGITGTFSVSFGTSLTGSEWTVGCEGGSVSISRSTVTTNINGDKERKDINDERTGVPPEVRHWGEAIVSGKQNERQKSEEALADLELLESMLRSGNSDGEPQDLTRQI
ncbi:MAG: hypothetical protein M1830_004087 [Pleopsidium flavum]|nr:MAG: hypothetical protein M1830_004087 [Pleopsidium flavum]